MSKNWPKTKAEAQAYRYTKWKGLPDGKAHDPSMCAAEVQAREMMFGYGRQCHRIPHAGPDSMYCTQHAKIMADASKGGEQG